MYWDGNNFPSVEAPIGSFFGQGWNEAYPYHSQPISVAPGEANALVSYFAMPFAKGARIEIENQNEREIEELEKYKVKASGKAYQFWERNSLSIDLWSTPVFLQKLNYMHQ